MVRDITNAILTTDRNRELILKKGRAASERIALNFTEENYRKAVNSVYVLITEHSRK